MVTRPPQEKQEDRGIMPLVKNVPLWGVLAALVTLITILATVRSELVSIKDAILENRTATANVQAKVEGLSNSMIRTEGRYEALHDDVERLERELGLVKVDVEELMIDKHAREKPQHR